MIRKFIIYFRDTKRSNPRLQKQKHDKIVGEFRLRSMTTGQDSHELASIVLNEAQLPSHTNPEHLGFSEHNNGQTLGLN